MTLGAALPLFAAVYFLPDARGFGGFAVATLVFFIIICLVLYAMGLNAAKSTNKLAFTGLISISVFGKMVLSLLFLGVYRKVAAPEGSLWVIMFLLTYAVYTGYEVWFMSKLGRIKA